MYKLSVIIPFFKNIDSNIEQEFINEFCSMAKSTLKNIQLIFIDDCSPIPVNVKITNDNLNFNLYRIDTDITWNVGGAKNLGAYLSDAEKLLFLDADHSINEKNIKILIDYNINENEHIVFMRGKIGAPGIFCTTKKRFMSLNGFDEYFSGYYGSEDKNYIWRHRNNYGKFIKLDKMVSVREEYRHHSLCRNTNRNKEIAENIIHSGLFINYEWHKVV